MLLWYVLRFVPQTRDDDFVFLRSGGRILVETHGSLLLYHIIVQVSGSYFWRIRTGKVCVHLLDGTSFGWQKKQAAAGSSNNR